MRVTDEVRQAEVGVQRKVVLSAQGGLGIPVRVAVTCNPSKAVTLPNIAVPHYIGVPAELPTYSPPSVCCALHCVTVQTSFQIWLVGGESSSLTTYWSEST